MKDQEQIAEATKCIQKNLDFQEVELGLVLGSGLKDFAKSLVNPKSLGFDEIPHFIAPKVQGHGNRLLVGMVEGKKVALLEGRVHYYEGHSMKEVTFPIRVLANLGIKTLILTNAAGGIEGEAGQLMVITDHLDLFCPNPLIGPNFEEFGERFPDLSRVYDIKLRDLALETGKQLGVKISQGVYAYLTGPSYETPIDIQVLARLGVSAVGMSTVPEAIVGVHSGMNILGISCITNLAAGISDKPLSHQEVVETTGRVAEDFSRLLRGIIRGIS